MRRRSAALELPLLLVAALALALVIKSLLVQPFSIPSGSMERTLHGCPGCHGDRVLVNKVVYQVRGIHRGEIVVFRGPPSWRAEVDPPVPASNAVTGAIRAVARAVGLAPGDEKDFIKRVIAVGGDTVMCCDARGRVVVDGVALDEPYVFEDDHQPFGPVTVPRGRLWVMGDHRSYSADSRDESHRADHQGTIPVSAVVGRAFVRVWPPQRVGVLEVPKTFLATRGAPAVPLLAGGVGALGLGAARRRRRARTRAVPARAVPRAVR